MTSFGHYPHRLDLFVSPVDQANKAAEQCTDQGEDNQVCEEYQHPPWLLGGCSLEDPPYPAVAADWPKLLREPEGRGAEGTEGEMQSANKEANNVKLLIRFNLVKVKIKFCQTS